jgi:hypothetical protein
MSPGLPRKSPARWPFWLLVAAWWCANAPQAATFEAILWLKGAAAFSHQADLHAEVAALLSGVPRTRQPHSFRAANPLPSPATVPISARLAIQRVELNLEAELSRTPAQQAGEAVAIADDRVPDRRICPPRLRPPRLS